MERRIEIGISCMAQDFLHNDCHRRNLRHFFQICFHSIPFCTILKPPDSLPFPEKYPRTDSHQSHPSNAVSPLKIRPTDTSPSSIETILYYLYTLTLPSHYLFLRDISSALDLFIACDRYAISALKHHVETQLCLFYDSDRSHPPPIPEEFSAEPTFTSTATYDANTFWTDRHGVVRKRAQKKRHGPKYWPAKSQSQFADVLSRVYEVDADVEIAALKRSVVRFIVRNEGVVLGWAGVQECIDADGRLSRDLIGELATAYRLARDERERLQVENEELRSENERLEEEAEGWEDESEELLLEGLQTAWCEMMNGESWMWDGQYEYSYYEEEYLPYGHRQAGYQYPGYGAMHVVGYSAAEADRWLQEQAELAEVDYSDEEAEEPEPPRLEDEYGHLVEWGDLNEEQQARVR